MTTVPISPEQAAHVAQLLTLAQQTQQAAQQALSLLALGRVPAGSRFVGMEPAALVFDVPAPPETPPDGD